MPRIPEKSISKGFTVVELMIMVAIIGIMASVIIPNFMKFRAKAEQSEAKSNLRSAYNAAKAKYAEVGTYSTLGLTTDNGKISIGFAPEANNLYNYFGVSSVDVITGSKGNFSHVQGTGGTCGANVGTAWTTGFVVRAIANIDTDTTTDGWQMDSCNNLANASSAITFSYGVCATVAQGEGCNDVLY